MSEALFYHRRSLFAQWLDLARMQRLTSADFALFAGCCVLVVGIMAGVMAVTP